MMITIALMSSASKVLVAMARRSSWRAIAIKVTAVAQMTWWRTRLRSNVPSLFQFSTEYMTLAVTHACTIMSSAILRFSTDGVSFRG